MPFGVLKLHPPSLERLSTRMLLDPVQTVVSIDRVALPIISRRGPMAHSIDEPHYHSTLLNHAGWPIWLGVAMK